MGTAEPFRGQASDVCFSQSPWFNADEIPADAWGGYVVQIEEVRARRGVKFNKGKAREAELFLKFVGIEKELRVNVTIRRTLDEAISPICGDWFGKWITLFVQGGIDTSEGKKNGVRVRPSLPPQGAPKPAAPRAPSFCTTVLAAISELSKAGADGAETVKAAIAAAGLAGRKPSTWTDDEARLVNAKMPDAFRVQ